MSTFVSRIAKELLSSSVPLHRQMVLLPNQRAELFVREELKKHVSQPTLLPLFSTVDGFISSASNLLIVEPLVLLIELHQCFNQTRQEAHPDKPLESLGNFLSWGQTLLSDFEEIDRYKLNADHILGDLYNVQKLTEWDLDAASETALMQRYSDFVALLPDTYKQFNGVLIERGEAHGGLASRHLSERPDLIEEFLKKNGIEKTTVAGLNALNTAELDILGYLKQHSESKVLWDLDPHYVDMEEHEAGLFLRTHKHRQKTFGKDVPTTKGLSSDFLSKPKEITPVGASKYSGQAKAVANALKTWASQGIAPNKIAVVLADEALLNPVLSILPSAYSKVNITMGYPLDQTKVACTLRLWMSVIEYAVKNEKSTKRWSFYHSNLTALFSDPLFSSYYYDENTSEGPREWNQGIVQGNRVFTSSKEWEEKFTQGPSGYQNLLSPTHGLNVLDSIKLWLKHISSVEKADTMVINTAYKVFTLLNQLERTIGSRDIDTLSLLKLVRQQLKSGTIDFIGEPLEGLQIMGILESRTLDFEYVILAGVNEGVLPAGRSFNSLLPYDIKQNYKLPTYEQKDAIFAYHFYRLLQRSKDAVITFNTNKDAMGGGEPSRYIVQLEQELNKDACTVHPRIYSSGDILPSSIEDRFFAPRTTQVKEALKEWMARGISASSINTLAGHPDQFYQQKLIRLDETKEVEESMSALVMGTLVHDGLEGVYAPFVGKPIPEINIEQWTQKALEMGIQQLIKEGYSERVLYQGRNLITLEVCKTMIQQFLSYDSIRSKSGATIIKGIETELQLEMEHPSLGIALKFSGRVDRIELYNGHLTVWDYKTGGLDSSDLSLGTWEDLWNGKKPKVLQCLLYAWMLWKEQRFDMPLPWQFGMFKLQSSTPEFFLKGKAFKSSLVEEEDLIRFEQELMAFLENQLHTDDPFVEAPPKSY